MVYPAHILIQANQIAIIQSVQEHCRNTAQIAAGRLDCIHLFHTGYLAGLLHDMGKFTSQFKAYLEQAATGAPVRPGSVIHTFGAARLILEYFHTADTCASFQDITSELIGYAAAAHHGLFDCVDEQHKYGFSHRLNWDNELYAEAKDQFFAQCSDEAEVRHLFAQAHQELIPIYDWINRQGSEHDEEIFFHLGLLARLILSSVIDGDRQDTAQFFGREPVSFHAGTVPAIWDHALHRTEERLNGFPASTPVQCARQEISRICRQAGRNPVGVYQLSVPTGAGKTLSSLRFALAHAAQHKMQRVVFVSPLLSILEQNAAVLREFLQEDDLILEHHSNVVQERTSSGELDPHELLAESWDAPIIITTLVQLLDTLFAGKTSCIRRFQALCNCVLVIDEVQTVPSHMLSLFNLSVNFLVHVCSATVLLCSATQPCFDQVTRPIYGTPENLVPYTPELWAPFQRTTLIDAGSRRLDEIPEFALEQLARTNSLLVICNTKQQARFLYQQLQYPGVLCFHLSAAMCPEHRRDVLSCLRQALKQRRKEHQKVLCISTQVIEAGVDISFDCVIRFTAGLDNAIQAAGRCNRNGEASSPLPVFLLTCSDEDLSRLSEIQAAKTATLQLLSAFHQNPSQFKNDLASESAIVRYYQNLYGGMRTGAQDYPLKNGSTVFDLLSVNAAYADSMEDHERFGLHQAFASAGSQFQVFDQETTDIVVPYKAGSAVIAELCATAKPYQLKRQKDLLSQAKPYIISVYRFQLENLKKLGGLFPLLDGSAFALDSKFYDQNTGLRSEPGCADFLEV